MQRLTGRDGHKYLYLPITVPQKILVKQRTAIIAILAAMTIGVGVGITVLGSGFASTGPSSLNCLAPSRYHNAHHITAGGHLVWVKVRDAKPYACSVIVPMWAAGDRITGTPYFYGGGHGVSRTRQVGAYDCSGSVSYIAYYGNLIDATTNYVSGDYSPGNPNILLHGRALDLGVGKYITFWANAGHVFMQVDGRWWDDGQHAGWYLYQPQSTDGFIATHPEGL